PARRTRKAPLAVGRGGGQRQLDPRARPQGGESMKPPSSTKRAGVIGGGAWGTALAQVCARAGLETTLWAREADVVASVNASHENTSFLPGVDLEPSIRATGDFAELAES